MYPFTPVLVLVSVLVATGGSGAARSRAAAPRAVLPAPSERITIRADVNGLLVAVGADGTLVPASSTAGAAEQFELYELGKGLLAIRSAASGKFVSARDGQPLRSVSDDVGESETFRRVGASQGALRLRSITARGFVCAADAGQAAMTTAVRCPHAWQLLHVEAIRPVPPSFAITVPAPGTALRATTVTFHWDTGGEDAWLKVGSLPGAADIYASGAPGAVSEHTVTGLPLNGQTVYVEVSRKTGAVVESVSIWYTAAIRRGLAVITDFADRRLESWDGPGMRSEADLAAQLRSMEAHWAWLSRGLETFRWDIIRIQLPHPAREDAYPGWTAFRDAAITLVRQQVQTADYDVNVDDVIDAVWLIVSSGYEPVPFSIGGMSRNAGANLFVDGQASGSVQAGATGNFTHELGHCLGLPDMYGTYTTLNKLTVMADSWALPPQDFAAYERIALGWVKPRAITESTRGVWLPSAHEQLAAIKVPTIRTTEYFLIEFRNPPSAGFGSATQGYRGLAVYHVLEGSSMWQDPPIVRLEPADGDNVPNQELDPEDFVYPENPSLLRPLMLRSYYDDRDDVFRLENVVWTDGGLAFDVIVLPQPPPAATNLLINGSFEHGASGLPDNWHATSFVPQDATFVWPAPVAFSGSGSAYLESAYGNDLRWAQFVPVIPDEQYVLCGVLKGEAVQGVQGDVGANVSVMGGFVRSEGLSGTFDWTKTCVAFQADAPQAEVACRLGFFGSTASGRLWCDELTLEHVRLHSAFEP